MHRSRALAALPLLLAALAAPATAAPIDLTLSMASLPSAQGWTYVANGSHAGVLESSVFSVSGGVFTQNTIGQANGVAGGGLFYQLAGGITTTEPKQLRVSMKCLQVQGSVTYPTGQGGIFFGFATGSAQYGFSVTLSEVFLLTSSGFVQTASGLDNVSAYHDYVFEWSSPTSFRVYRDGVLSGTATAGSALAANRVLFGDGTGGSNARADIRALRFIQDLPTPAPTSTWGRLKQLWR